MMRFEYNSNCNYEEKINLISKEIMDEYSLISESDARKIAALDKSIDDKYTNDDVFWRYYVILLVITKNHLAYNQVIIDLVTVYNSGINDEINIGLMEEIVRYHKNQRDTFPLAGEFY